MKRKLQQAFNRGVDGRNANLFLLVRLAMRELNLNTAPNASKTITMGELYSILIKTENKQEKGID